MKRAAGHAALARQWWLHLLLAFAPLGASLAWGHAQEALAWLATPLFVAALCSMFVTLPLFRRYKHALIAAGRSRDGADEAQRWAELASAQRRGVLGASLPAWIGTLACFTELFGAVILLLGLTSLMLFWLYRVPRLLL